MEVYKALERLPDRRVREAVQRCLPRSAGQFFPKLHRLARHLKAIDAGETAFGWCSVVEVWYFLARPRKPDVRRPEADRHFAAALEAAGGESPTAWIGHAVRGSATALEAVTRLARHLGRKTFYLSTRTLADAMGFSPATAARRLSALVADGSLKTVRVGLPHLYDRTATTYDASPLFALTDWQPRRSHSISSLLLRLPDPPEEVIENTSREASGIPLVCLTGHGRSEDEYENDAFDAAFDLLDALDRAGEPPGAAPDRPEWCPF